MAYKILMPKLGLTMKEGTVSKWLKKEGEEVKEGEPIVEVMTDKITNQVEAPGEGILKQIVIPEGGKVKVSEVIGIIADANEEVGETSAKQQPTPNESKGKQDKKGRLRVSPAARRVAKENNIPLEKVTPTGPGGRIVLDDVKKYIEAAKETAGVESKQDISVKQEGETVPLVGMRQVIAQRMLESWHKSPHVTVTMEVDMTGAIKLREKIKHKYETKITYTDVIVKACGKALKDYPGVNATIEDDKIKKFNQINVGVAVALDDGLIVPVIKSADKKGLLEINKEVKALASKARKGGLENDEIQGGSFTVTNLGMYGVDIFTPIINPPESAILGVGKISRRPVLDKDDNIEIKPMMWLSLSFDHRLIDGATAAQFLSRVKDYLENPELLVI